MNESKRNSKRKSKEVQEELKKYLETNENVKIQTLCNVAKSVLREKFIAMH